MRWRVSQGHLFIKVQGAEPPLQLGEQIGLRDPPQLLEALLPQLEGCLRKWHWNCLNLL